MTVSVVLATYNGRRYLKQQLRSVLEQSHPPDEILINDDGSSDGSLELVRTILDGAEIRVDVRQNERRLGTVRSFGDMTRRATGDVIFFADQDDIWSKDKVATMVSAFESRPNVGAVFSDARLIDEHSRPIGRSLWEAIDFAPRFQRAWVGGAKNAVLVQRSIATGATLAFLSRYRDAVLPFPADGMHDFWVVFVIAQMADVVTLPEPLVHYRVHGSNQIGVGRAGLRWRAEDAISEREAELQQFLALRHRLETLGLLTAPLGGLLNAKIQHLRFRANLPATFWQRATGVAKRVSSGEYGRYARGMRSAIGDIVRGPGKGDARADHPW